jgi:serine/threonine-protein kinase RsbW
MSNQRWQWSFDQRIPNDTAVARQLLDDLIAQLKQANWSEHDVFGVHLSVEEALVNAIKHGNRGDPDKEVQVKIGVSADRIRVEITDQGPGFRPEDVPDPTLEENLETPSGRGLMLMRTFMSKVQHNARGNGVLMEKDRS